MKRKGIEGGRDPFRNRRQCGAPIRGTERGRGGFGRRRVKALFGITCNSSVRISSRKAERAAAEQRGQFNLLEYARNNWAAWTEKGILPSYRGAGVVACTQFERKKRSQSVQIRGIIALRDVQDSIQIASLSNCCCTDRDPTIAIQLFPISPRSACQLLLFSASQFPFLLICTLLLRKRCQRRLSSERITKGPSTCTT